MPSDRAFSPETRAVKGAAEDIKRVIDSFKGEKRRFMATPRTSRTQRIHEIVANSDAARRLVAEGYTLEFAYRVARLEEQYKKQDPLGSLIESAEAEAQVEPTPPMQPGYGRAAL